MIQIIAIFPLSHLFHSFFHNISVLRYQELRIIIYTDIFIFYLPIHTPLFTKIKVLTINTIIFMHKRRKSGVKVFSKGTGALCDTCRNTILTS